MKLPRDIRGEQLVNVLCRKWGYRRTQACFEGSDPQDALIEAVIALILSALASSMGRRLQTTDRPPSPS